MFQGQPAFYFATIRKVSLAFGTLFKNVYIQRFEGVGGKGTVTRTIRVPVSYGAGSKWYVQRKQDISAGEGVQTKISLPRIAFEMTGLQYDANRQLSPLGNNTAINTSDASSFLKQLQPVPYDFQFDVAIAVKNIDDALQIVEQIIPSFSPSYNLSVNDIPELNIGRDIPVIFSGIQMTDQYEGAFDDLRIQEWTLSFIVKGYLYPPIRDAEVIKKVFGNIYKDKTLNDKQSVVTVEVDPIASSFDETWSDSVNFYEESDLDSNGEPNS